MLNTVFLSILNRERERTVTVFHYLFQCVPVRTFLGVPEGSALQPSGVSDRLHEFHERS
jgi:hypothetical protein